MDAHKNFAQSLVATAPSPGSSGTSLVVTAGDGTKFPAVPFNATIWPAAIAPTSANAEIVRVTAIATDTLTITRTQESSTARTVIVGDQIAATITAKTLTDVEATMTATVGGLVPPPPNNTTTFLRGDATFAAPAGGAVTKIVLTANFESIGTRYNLRTDNSSIVTATQNGLDMSTGTTAGGSARMIWQHAPSFSNNFECYNGNPTWSASICAGATGGGAGDFYIGLGQPTYNIGNAITFTPVHIGFKIIKAAGVTSLYATQADGVTEDASAALTTLAAADVLDLIVVVTSGVSADFYWRKNGGALSAKTTLNTKPPAAATVDGTITDFLISNDGGTINYEFTIASVSYTR